LARLGGGGGRGRVRRRGLDDDVAKGSWGEDKGGDWGIPVLCRGVSVYVTFVDNTTVEWNLLICRHLKRLELSMAKICLVVFSSPP
jgi:hypothetical protein